MSTAIVQKFTSVKVTREKFGQVKGKFLCGIGGLGGLSGVVEVTQVREQV